MFSSSTKYAIRTVIYLSRQEEGSKKYKVEDIAKVLQIPKPFLSKILQRLSKSDILSSAKGRGGGFYLSKANLNRTLIDIVISIEGHDVFEKCILGLAKCGDENPCYLHHYYKPLKTELHMVVKEVSIKNLHDDDVRKMSTLFA